MLIKCDASQLEWRVKVELARDQVAIDEILSNADIHSDNMIKFGLPERVWAKIFLYRMIFADAFGNRGFKGPAYAYANDFEFNKISSSISFWERAVGAFFQKYRGVEEHSRALLRTAMESGQIVSPSGRVYRYSPKHRNGDPYWPNTEILNHVVQGFATGDLMMLGRLIVNSRLKELGYGAKALLINSMHDDVQLDVDNDVEMAYNIVITLKKAFQDIPKNAEKMFGYKMVVPLDADVSFGMNLKDMIELKKPEHYEFDYFKTKFEEKLNDS